MLRSINIAVPCIGAEEEHAVVDALRSGWISHGPRCSQFEREMAANVGVAHGRAVNSGTSAIQLTLEACRIGRGHEVIVPAFTCVAAVFPIEHVGATPVIVDIELSRYGIDASRLEAAITPRTKAIVVAHLFGCAAEVEAVIEVATRHDIKVIEDNALGLGARVGDRWTGSFGDAACL